MKKEKSPHISLNELIKYLYEHDPSKRKKIVKQQKYPSDFITIYYKIATDTIIEFLQDMDEEVIVVKIDELIENIAGCSKSEGNKKTRLSKNLTVLQRFYDSYEDLNLEKYQITFPSNRSARMDFENVEVSIRPDFYIKDQHAMGAVKLFFSSTNSLDEEMGKTAAALLFEYTKDSKKSTKVDNKLCMIYDVFAGEIFVASPTNKRRLVKIKDACSMIYLLWDTITNE